MIPGAGVSIGRSEKILASPIVDDFEGTYTGSSGSIPPGWTTDANLPGGTSKTTTNPFSGSASFRLIPGYDGDVTYLNRTWTKTPFALGTRNRLKIRKARAPAGNNNLQSDEIIKFNTVTMSGGLILSTTDTGISGPQGSGTYTWREYVIDISAYSGTTFTLTIEPQSVNNTNVWPYFDKFEFYEV